MGTQILIPTDGTDMAADRIERVFEIAQRHDAAVHVLYVVDTRRYGEPALSSVEVLIDCFEDDGRAHLRSLVTEGQRQGVSVEGHCRHGDPPVEIVAAAEELDIDLVVPHLVDVTPTALRRQGLEAERIGDTRPPAKA